MSSASLPGQVHQPSDQLRRAAGGVRAHLERAALDEFGSAARACCRHVHRRSAVSSFFVDPFDDVRDHVPGPLQPHEVAFPDVLAEHLRPVVQAGARDRHAAELDRREERDRSHDAGASDAPRHLVNAGDLLARRELEGEGPARVARGRAEVLARDQVVELHDHAVDLEIQLVPARLEIAVVFEDALRFPAPSATARSPASPTRATSRATRAGGQPGACRPSPRQARRRHRRTAAGWR